MTNLTIKPNFFPDTFHIPGSKSHANRLLILASIDSRKITLEDVPDSTDVVKLIQALKTIGLSILHLKSSLVIENSFPACESETESEEIEIDIGEGGTTGRFLACLLLLGNKTYKLKLGKRLAQRPWREFLEVATELGVKAELNDTLLTLKGPIQNYPTTLEVDCSRTTQFATGLQLAMSFKTTKIIPQKLKSSISYWDLTQNLIDNFKEENKYFIPRDWSSASYPLAFGALTQKIFIPELKFDPLQADSKFYNLLRDLGAIYVDQEGIEVGLMRKPQSIQFDVSDCLDLVPALAFLMAHLPGKHTLQGVKNLKHKESDRLQEICHLLAKFKRNYELLDNQLLIHGSSDHLSESVKLELPDDHRIVMTGTLFLLFHSGGTIGPIESVDKSFPLFFSQLSKI